MVGGNVIEVIALPTRVWVNCKCPTYGDECAIYVERSTDSLSIKAGDKLWWQGSSAYWSSQDAGSPADVPILRIGFSGASRPEGH